MDPQTPNPSSGDSKYRVDPESILLPKKEIHSPDTAQRGNAAELLKSAPVAATPPPATPAPVQPVNPDEVRALETFQGDVEDLVQKQKVSVLNIAAAEADKRAQEGSGAVETVRVIGGQFIMVLLGSILLIVALGAVAYVYIKRQETVPIAQAPQAPFIVVDTAETISLSSDETHDELMQALVQAQQTTDLSLNLVERLDIVSPAADKNTPPSEASPQTALLVLAPNMPDTLLRTIQSPFLLGLHEFDGTQAFLILNVDSYEQAYSGMLAWEDHMQTDLQPLFTYTPPAHIIEPASVATTTASSTTAVASSTSSSTTPVAQPFLPTGFTDAVVENHDSRVILDSSGDIVLLWTFLDRDTLVITTNKDTLNEIISRRTTAPTAALPNQ